MIRSLAHTPSSENETISSLSLIEKCLPRTHARTRAERSGASCFWDGDDLIYGTVHGRSSAVDSAGSFFN